MSLTLLNAGSLSGDDDDAAAAEAAEDDEWPEHPAPAERQLMLQAGFEAAALTPSPQPLGPLEVQEYADSMFSMVQLPVRPSLQTSEQQPSPPGCHLCNRGFCLH